MTYKILETLQDHGRTLAGFVVHRDFQTALEIHDHEDLESIAMLGILEAARKYDATKGVSFKTFACKKARQRIIDFVRQKRHRHIASINEIPDIELKARKVFR